MNRDDMWKEEEKLTLQQRRQRYKCDIQSLNSLETVPTWKAYLETHHNLKIKKETNSTEKKDFEPSVDINKKVSLWKGNICTLEIDSIQNAANESLLGGGGIDGAIHKAASSLLLKETRQLNGAKTGETKISRGYCLPAKFVLHTVGPRGEREDKLESCYRTTLNRLKEHKLRSVGLCCVSTGIFGYPLEKATRVALRTVRRWLEESDGKTKNWELVDRIIFVMYNDKEKEVYEEIMPTYFPPAEDAAATSPTKDAPASKSEQSSTFTNIESSSSPSSPSSPSPSSSSSSSSSSSLSSSSSSSSASQQTKDQEFRRRAVVSSFLVSSSSGRILLLKRSDKVRTYQHHYAVVSGSLEPTDTKPESRARQEILEETALGNDDVVLLRQGRALEVPATDLGVLWTVHPFLFQVNPNSEKKIQIDWEHDSSEWIETNQVVKMKTVPDLVKSLRRVWVPSPISKILQSIKDDRSMGANQMVIKAMDILIEATSSTSIKEMETTISAFHDANDFYSYLVDMAHHAVQIRPSMSSNISNILGSILLHLTSVISSKPSITIADLCAEVQSTIQNKHKEREAQQTKINQTASSLILPTRSPSSSHSTVTILTTSASSTIASLLVHLQNSLPPNTSLHVMVTESRPLNEGALSLIPNLHALTLSPPSSGSTPGSEKSTPMKLTLITDAAVLYHLRHDPIDVVLLGADQIFADGSGTVNKIGSALIATAARSVRSRPIKIYVVAQADKISPAPGAHEPEEMSASELTSSYGEKWSKSNLSNVSIRNVYFEDLSSDLIDGYISDRGLLTQEQIKSIWENEYSKAYDIFKVSN